MQRFPTAQEAFSAVLESLVQRAGEIVLEYALKPGTGGPTTTARLSDLKCDSSPTRFQPPCGWQRLWRITCGDDVLWDRSLRVCRAPVPAEGRLAENQADRRHIIKPGCYSGVGLDCLPAELLARVIFCCDIATLLRLARALPGLGRLALHTSGAPEHVIDVRQAMPRPDGNLGHELCLSFARASLRWAELWDLTWTTLQRKRPQSSQPDLKQRRQRFSFVSQDGIATATLPSETVAVACGGGTISLLLTTGHVHAIRIWQLPTLERLGMIRVRGTPKVMSLGGQDLLLAAACFDGKATFAYVWDLTEGFGTPAVLWHLPLAGIVALCLFESGNALAIADSEGIKLFTARFGHCYAVVQLPQGMPIAGCGVPDGTSCPQAVLVVGTVRGLWKVSSAPSALNSMCADGYRLSGEAKHAHSVSLEDFGALGDFKDSALKSVSASRDEVVALAGFFVVVWRLIDCQLLSFVDLVPMISESVSWSFPSVEALLASCSNEDSSSGLQVDRLFVTEEVICCSVVNGGRRGLIACHSRSCSKLPHPWHMAGPLDVGASPQGATSQFLMLEEKAPHMLAADPTMRWLVASVDGNPSFTRIVARGSNTCDAQDQNHGQDAAIFW